MALTLVDTPLKGGLNTPLHQQQITAPGPAAPQTPNALLATPFRTPSIGDGTPSVRGPPGSVTPGATPLRDQLSINAEGALVPASSERALKQYQKSVRASLEQSLSQLPASANDFEIVVNEEDPEHLAESAESSEKFIEDQSDLDARREADAEAARVAALKKRSQAVQRDLPRPHTVNKSVLRPSDVSCTELQRAEEMIKREMIVMLHYDALHSPLTTGKKSAQDGHADYLQTHPYRHFTEQQMAEAKNILQKEMKVRIWPYCNVGWGLSSRL